MDPSSSGQSLEDLFEQTRLVNPVTSRREAESATQPIAAAFTHQSILPPLLALTQGQQPYGAEVRLEDLLALPPAGQLRNQHDALRSQVYAEIRSRLIESPGVDIQDMHILLFSFMLPKANAVVREWSMLINLPIFVPTAALCTMMDLSEAQRIWKNPIEGSTTYYVRTFTLKLHELVDLLQLLFDEYQGSNFPEQLAVIWNLVVRFWEKGQMDRLIYIRYIGQTGRSAWRRYQEDLDHSLTSGLNRAFIQTCQKHFPNVLQNAEIHEFEYGRIEVPLKSSQRQIADRREQALIALFGSSTLLNSSKGGFDATIKANDVDINDFVALRTKVIERLENCPSPPNLGNALSTYGSAIQKYTADHPISTKAGACPISDVIKNLIVRQATPTILKGYAPLCIIGSDLGLEAYQNEKPFFDGITRASALTVRMLNELIHAELGFSTTSEHHVTSLQRDHPLPFVDLFPWAKKDVAADLPGATIILRQYLQIINPLVLLTFSDVVSNVALAAFQGKKGIPRGKTITQISGEIYMSKYDKTANGVEDGNCCLVIPCVHPGALTHSNDNKTLARIFAKSLSVAWLALNIALKLLQDGPTPALKKSLCKQIMTSVQSLTGPETAFGRTFQKLRSEYTEDLVQSKTRRLGNTDAKWQRQLDRAKAFAHSNKQQNLLAVSDAIALSSRHKITWIGDGATIPSAVVRVKKALEELYTIVDYGIAKGGPADPARKIQVDSLCNFAIPFLNGQDLSRADFENRLNNVKSGDLYYFTMTTVSEQVSDLPHLLTFFADDSVDHENATKAEMESLMQSAVSDLTDFVSSRVVVNESRDETYANIGAAFDVLLKDKDKELAKLISELRRAEPFQVTTYETSPHRVLVRQIREHGHSVLHFKWKYEGETHIIEDLVLPLSAAPVVVGEERYIYFDENGIDIRDAKDRSLGTAENRTVTLPLEQLIALLSGHPFRNKLLRFWEHETGMNVNRKLLGEDTLVFKPTSTTTTKLQAYPAEFFKGEGRGLPVKNLKGASEKAKVKHIQETLFPVDTSDVTWLLNRFLEENYPTKGDINMGSPVLWPQDTTFWGELQVFLSKPLYHFHPHRQTLAAACATVRDIEENLRVRGPNTEPNQIFRTIIRLITALRGEVKESRVSHTTPPRFKIILTVPGKNKLTAGAIKQVDDPELVFVDDVTTIEEVVHDDEDDEEETGKVTKKLKRYADDDEDEDEMLITD